jgi:hypothetical protein
MAALWHRERVEYKFVLANSATMVNIGELKATNKSVELILNRPGSASFRLPMNEDLAEEVVEHTTCVKVYRITPTTNQLIWSGPIWNVEDIAHQDAIQVSCVGWFEYLNRRQLRYEKIYSGGTWNAGAIALDLLNIANNQKDGPLSPTFPDGTGTTRPTGIVVGTSTDTSMHNRTYAPWSNIGAAILEWSDIENGYDFEITPDTKTMNIYPSAFPGQINRDRPQAQFGFNWGPHNLLEFTRTREMNSLRNSQIAQGRLGLTALAQNTTSMNTYGLHEGVDQLSQIKELGSLQAFASAEVAVRSIPRVVYKVLPHPFAPDHLHVPEPFVDYRVGDRVYITAKKEPRISILRQAVRVYAMSITVDEQGWERVSNLQLSPNGVG